MTWFELPLQITLCVAKHVGSALEETVLHTRFHQATSISLPENLVSILRNNISIQPITHRPRYSEKRELRRGGEGKEASANPQDGLAPNMGAAFLRVNIHHSRKVLWRVVQDGQCTPRVALQRGVLELPRVVEAEAEVHAAVAHIADTVKYDDPVAASHEALGLQVFGGPGALGCCGGGGGGAHARTTGA